MKIAWTRLIKVLLVVFLVVFSVGFGFSAYMIWGMESLPEVDQPQTSRFYYHNQELMTTQFVENRTKVSLDEIAEEVIWATIAVEDRRFFDHSGFDLVGISRAAYRNLQEGQIIQGGSTITQQLAKNLFLSHDRTWQRKLEEAAITVQLERNFSKEEVLQKYLNTIYYGHATYGIEAAAQLYFEKPAAKLSLAEAALLAGLPRGPADYSPFIKEEATYKRQQKVLNLMKKEGFITAEEKEKALDQELSFEDKPSLPRDNNYVVDQVLNRELKEITGKDPDAIQKGGLNLHTTIDPHMQETAERILREELPTTGKDKHDVTQPQGALIALNPNTGEIRALAGGRDYQETMLNRVNKLRSPGSAFKPFVYAAALENGYTAAHTFTCEPVSFKEEGMDKPYEPTDFEGGFHYEDLTLRKALSESCNITAVKLGQELGANKIIEMAEKLGVNSPIEANLSLPLGTSEVTLLEMTASYAAFANGGYRVEPVLLDKAIGSEGEILIDNSPQLDRVMNESVAYLMTDMMKDVVQSGSASTAANILQRPAAGKTGTSRDYKNVYMVGYTPELVVGIYIGDDQEDSLGETGGSLAAPLWAEFVEEASKDMALREFTRPEDILERTICPETGLLQSSNCTAKGQNELFIKGTAPKDDCSDEECPHIEEDTPWWHWDFWWGR